ncbi:MAG: hypothetical protein ACYC27_19580 [Armatimonadota bacterium]
MIFISQKRRSLQSRFSTPTGRRDRKGDRPASDTIVVSSNEPGNLYCCSKMEWDSLRLMWQYRGGGVVVV